MKKIFLILIFSVAGIIVHAHDRAAIDSILEITIYKTEYIADAEKALQMSEKINYTKGILFALDQLGVMQRNSASYSQSLIYHRRCLALAQKNADDNFIMRSFINLGVVYNRMDNYKTALDYFQKATPLAEKLKNDKEIASCLGNIGSLYISLGKNDEAMVYFRKSLAKAIEMNNYQGLAISNGQIGRIFELHGMLDSAMYYYQKNLQYSEGWNDNNGIAICYNSMGNVAKKKNSWKQALKFYQKALEINHLVNDKKYLSPNYANIGETYLNIGDIDNAEKNYQISLEIATEAGLIKNMSAAYEGLSQVYEKQKRYNEAIIAIKKYITLKDSVLNKDNLQQIEFLKTAFEVKEREQEITSIKAENKLLIWLSIAGGTILFLIVLVMIFRQVWLKKRTQLIATQAVLDGETQERTRLARDLHDGLGGMLSAVKFNLYQMKQENFIIDKTYVGVFEKALAMLDESVGELRRVAHHIMPESLVHSGLRISLEDFCRAIPNTHFEYFGDDRRLDKRLELMIYRCAYELINNAIKHSQAKNINVQLQIDEHCVSLTISDNGIGFDSEKAVKGSGLDNIRQRVLAYNGKFNICSEPNKGTEATIDIEN
jgi:signal transduction histidine kinase